VRPGTLGLQSLRIRNRDGEDLGSVEGVLVSADTGRPLYLAVHSGGWFRSRLFLVPIGEVSRSPEGEAFVVRLTQEQVMRFPGFDSIELDGLSDREIRRANRAIAEVFEPGIEYAEDDSLAAAWLTAPFRTPEWWSADLHLSAMAQDVSVSDDQDFAQPGDVLGIERGGAQVHLGQTPEDELVRQREAIAEARNRGAE
jgi:hypothetical protein